MFRVHFKGRVKIVTVRFERLGRSIIFRGKKYFKMLTTILGAISKEQEAWDDLVRGEKE